MKKLIFLCIALAITTFSIFTLNISPVIHELGSFDRYENYSKYLDKYNFIKDRKVSEILSEEYVPNDYENVNYNKFRISDEDKKIIFRVS